MGNRCFLPAALVGWLAGLLLTVNSERAAGQPYVFSVNKSVFHVQTNATAPILDPDNPWVVVMQVQSEDILFILSTVTVTPPGRPAIVLGLSSDLSGFQYNQEFATKTAMDAAFPAGTYTASIEDFFGDTTELPVDLSGDRYPKAPFIANFADAQAISTAADFGLEWTPLAGSTADDSVGLLVVSNRSTVVHSEAVAVDPPPTRMVIPAGTLVTGSSNYAAVININRTADYRPFDDGSEAGASFGVVTQLPVQAPFAPYLRWAYGSDALVRVRFNAIPGRAYRLDTSTDLPDWQPGASLTATQAYEELIDSPFGPRQFFRVVLLPP